MERPTSAPFNPQDFADGSRYWGSIENDFELPWIGDVTARLFGAYRYRTWNGSLGETDVYSALGGFIEQRKAFRVGQVEQLLHLANRCGQLPGGQLQ